MSRIFAAIFFFIGVIAWNGETLKAQINPTPVNFIEPGYQVAMVFDEPLHFIEIEIGKQQISGWSYGGVIQFAVSDVSRESADTRESINSMWYTGMRLQYSRMMNLQFGYFAGVTGGIGGVDLREVEGLQNGISRMSDEGGTILVLRPEVGIRIQWTRNTRVNIGANMLYAPILGGQALVGVPAARLGIRFGE